MKPLLIIGAGGHGKVVADTAFASGYHDISFLDDAWPEKTSNGAWAVIGKPASSEAAIFCGVGNNTARAAIFETFAIRDAPVLKHPSAVASPSCQIGQGTLLVAGSIVNADANIGAGTILNTACSVDHDCNIGDFVHISPGAHLAGNVCVGKRSWIGIGASVREGVTIGDDVFVAAGAVVISDVKNGARVCGVPARSM